MTVAVMVPLETDFTGDFKEAPELEALAMDLAHRHLELAFIRDWRLTVWWKAEAPSAGSGKETAWRCRKLSGELYHALQADWLIWLAADTARELEWGPQEIEALLYHEMLHCQLKGKEGEEKPAVRGHDVETFLREIDRYGLWRPDLQRAKRTFSQAVLPGFEEPALRPRLTTFLAQVDRGLPEPIEDIRFDEAALLVEMRGLVEDVGASMEKRALASSVSAKATALATQAFVLSELYRPGGDHAIETVTEVVDPDTGEILGPEEVEG